MFKISLDWDNVLYDLESVHKKFIKEQYNISIESNEVTSWDFYPKKFPKITNVWTNFELYSSGTLFQNSIEFVEKLSKEYGEHNIQIVTHSYNELIEEKDKFIKSFFPNLEVIHAKNKSKFTKGSILIDDGLHNILSHAEENRDYGIIFDLEYGWNKYDDINPLLFRAKSFDKIIRILKDLKAEYEYNI